MLVGGVPVGPLGGVPVGPVGGVPVCPVGGVPVGPVGGVPVGPVGAGCRPVTLDTVQRVGAGAVGGALVRQDVTKAILETLQPLTETRVGTEQKSIINFKKTSQSRHVMVSEKAT